MSIKFTSLSGLAGFGFGAPVSDPHWTSTVMLAGFNGADGAVAFSDESPSAHGAFGFFNQAQLDTAQQRFGTASLLCDGINDGVSLPDSDDWNLGSGQFTAECFVRWNVVAGDHLIGHFGNVTSEQGWEFFVTNADTVSFRYRDPTNLITHSGTTVATLVVNTWYHMAVDRDSANTLRIYVDGAMIGSFANITAAFKNVSILFTLGRRDITTGQNDLDGWLDECRLTKGVARYAGAFAPPTAPFPRFGV